MRVQCLFLVVSCLSASGCLNSTSTTCVDGLVCAAGYACHPGGGSCVETERVRACGDAPAGGGCLVAGSVGYCDADGVCELGCSRDCVEAGFDYGEIRCADGGDDVTSCGLLEEHRLTSIAGQIAGIYTNGIEMVAFSSEETHVFDGVSWRRGPSPGQVFGEFERSSAGGGRVYALAYNQTLGLDEVVELVGGDWVVRESGNLPLQISVAPDGTAYLARREGQQISVGVLGSEGFVSWALFDESLSIQAIDESSVYVFRGPAVDGPPSLVRLTDSEQHPVELPRPLVTLAGGLAETIYFTDFEAKHLVWFDGSAWGEIHFDDLLGPKLTMRERAYVAATGELFLEVADATAGNVGYARVRANRAEVLATLPETSVGTWGVPYRDGFVGFSVGAVMEFGSASWRPRWTPFQSQSFLGISAHGDRVVARTADSVTRIAETTCSVDIESEDFCTSREPLPIGGWCESEGALDCAASGCGEVSGPRDVQLTSDGSVVVIGDRAGRYQRHAGAVDVYCGDTFGELIDAEAARVLALDSHPEGGTLAVGQQGLIQRLEGSMWITDPPPTSDTLIDVTVHASGAFALSADGSVFALADGAWTELDAAFDSAVTMLWAAGPGDLYASGSGGVLFHYEQGATRRIGFGSDDDIVALVGTEYGDVFFATSDELYRLGSGTVSRVRTPVRSQAIVDLATGDGDVFVLTDAGTIWELLRLAPWE